MLCTLIIQTIFFRVCTCFFIFVCQHGQFVEKSKAPMDEGEGVLPRWMSCGPGK